MPEIQNCLYFIFSILFFSACATSSLPVTDKMMDLRGQGVALVNYNQPGDRPFYYNMHDDENTGVKAARKIVAKQGGVLWELQHTGNRYIEFQIDSITFSIDPNRIYTDTGVWRELDRTGRRDTIAFASVRDFATDLIETMEIDSQDLVITLHNNSKKGYSIEYYEPGGRYESDASAVWRGRRNDTDDFYFVTDTVLYEKLKPTGYHVVLQDNNTVTDDGSLSVYCGQRGIQYINVEAQHGHRCVQKKMIRRMLEALYLESSNLQ